MQEMSQLREKLQATEAELATLREKYEQACSQQEQLQSDKEQMEKQVGRLACPGRLWLDIRSMRRHSKVLASFAPPAKRTQHFACLVGSP